MTLALPVRAEVGDEWEWASRGKSKAPARAKRKETM